MNIIQKLEEIKKIENTSIQVKDMILKQGIITGSRLWGVHTPDSDIDIILPPNCSITFDECIRYHNGLYLHNKDETLHYVNNEFCSCYVFYNERVYNLLFMHTEETYNEWIFATQKMNEKIKDSSFKEKIKDKNFRVECFEEFKEEI